MKIKLPQKLKCLRCDYEWIPRKAEVLICPRCKRASWDKPKETEPAGLKA